MSPLPALLLGLALGVLAGRLHLAWLRRDVGAWAGRRGGARLVAGAVGRGVLVAALVALGARLGGAWGLAAALAGFLASGRILLSRLGAGHG